MGSHSEYWLQPSLGTDIDLCITVGPVTRTVGILTYCQLKALAVNRAVRLYDGLIRFKLSQLKGDELQWTWVCVESSSIAATLPSLRSKTVITVLYYCYYYHRKNVIVVAYYQFVYFRKGGTYKRIKDRGTDGQIEISNKQ